ncbi:MAG: tRNA lysidine(34) synthetase TilS [Syntrophomonas sp.]
MLNQVKDYIVKYQLINEGDYLIVAVSGGPDSMALLHIMKELQGIWNYKLGAAHLNHGLREDAQTEAEMVRQHCLDWGIPFYMRTADVRKAAREEKKSLEEAGRDCRYEFFHELLAELGANKIATAHHQGDMAETVLLHFLRGSGVKGLRGIMPGQGTLIRPLLTVSKIEIISYLEANAIKYAIDQSNYDLSFLRNRIRHQLIPELQREYNPRIVEALNRLGEMAREDNEALEVATRCYWDRVLVKKSSERIIINRIMLGELHPAYQSRIIREALFCLTGEAGWEYQDVLHVKELALKPGSSKTIRLKNGVTVNAVYKELHFCLRIPEAVPFCYELEVPGRIYIPEIGESYVFEIEDIPDLIINTKSPEHIFLKSGKIYGKSNGGKGCCASPLTPYALFNNICLDFDKLKKPLLIRSRQNGDRFHPPGIKGSKKIKDYFIDIKLPLSERNKVPILTADNEIYALLGFKVSRLAAVSPDTRRILNITREQ